MILAKPALLAYEVQRQGRQLVDLGTAAGSRPQVDVDQVALAALAGVHAQVRDSARSSAKMRQLGRARLLAARRARSSRAMDPGSGRAAGARQQARRRDQRLARLAEVRELRQAAAARAAAARRRASAASRAGCGASASRTGDARPRGRGTRRPALARRRPARRRTTAVRVAVVHRRSTASAQRRRPAATVASTTPGITCARDVGRQLVGRRARPSSARRNAGAPATSSSARVEPQQLRPTNGAVAPPSRSARRRPRHRSGRPLGHVAPSDLLDVDQERLELRRPRVGVAHERRQRVGEPVGALGRIAVGRDADEAPVDRDADVVDLLAADLSGPSRLVTTAATSSLPRLDDTRTRSPVLMPFSLRQLLGHLDERPPAAARPGAARAG